MFFQSLILQIEHKKLSKKKALHFYPFLSMWTFFVSAIMEFCLKAPPGYPASIGKFRGYVPTLTKSRYPQSRLCPVEISMVPGYISADTKFPVLQLFQV